MDARTREFMDLVHCEEWQVKDVPPDRIGVPPTYIPPERMVAAKKKTKAKKKPAKPGIRAARPKQLKLFFGKYKGRAIGNVPHDYLQWILNQDPDTAWFKTAQRHVKEYLLEHEATKMLQKSQPAVLSRPQGDDWGSELDSEYQQIVRK